MRSYGRRIIKRNIERLQDSRIESRDGVIKAIDLGNRLCEVIIQGSTKSLYARWPENYEQTPQYIRVGNAVRVAHTEGNQGRIEIIGHGILLPTTATGAGITLPPVSQGNGIVTGCVVSQIFPTATMHVTVSAGSVRIAGTVYTVPAVNLTLDAASATQFRYDIVVAGTDGVAEIVKGTNATSDPQMPTTPANHVLLQHILVAPNATFIDNVAIGSFYTGPVASTISMAFGTTPLHGHSIGNPHFDSTSTLTITIKDQYGNAISKGTPGWSVVISFFRGNGSVNCGGTVFNQSSGPQTFTTTSGQLIMTYTRLGTYAGSPPAYAGNGEKSPVFVFHTTTSTYEIDGMSSVLQLWDDSDQAQL